MTGISFVVALKTGLGLNSRDGWQARMRRTKKERQAIALAWLVFVPKVKTAELRPPLEITLTRIKPSGKPLDSDNLPGVLKATRDQVAQQLGIDDGDETKATWKCAQEQGPWGVKIEISANPRAEVTVMATGPIAE